MKKASSRLLVIDASVARAAGETQHPVSSSCRIFLLEVLEICHRVAMNPILREEWERHQSRFTRKWRRSMAAKQKPLDDIDTIPLPLALQSFSEKARMAIEKDMHLIELALAADKEIVTLDDALHKALGSNTKGERQRDRITWHNPCH